MTDNRRLAAILAADIVGFSRLVGLNEDRTLAQLRALQHDVVTPLVARHGGRVFKQTGDGVLVEFRSVVNAVRCAIEVQHHVIERNSGSPDELCLELRIGVHIGEVIEEPDGDLLGDGVNIAARLEGAAEANGVCLSQAAYDLVRDKVDHSFEDGGEALLKNMVRPIRLHRLTLQSGRDRKPPVLSPTAPGPSIAVLPFQNLGGDAEQDYFADGIVEDLIIGLSRIRWLVVIARNSSSVYRDRAVDVRVIGRDLAVRYVLEGSVRRAHGRIRITAQLIDAATGAHLWADRYDGAADEVFDLQDRITDSVVGIVEPQLRRSEIERSRRKRPDNLDAYDLYLQALPHVMRLQIDEVEAGAALLTRALALDPEYAAAHALLAWCYETRFTQNFNPADKAQALEHAQAAVAGSADDPMALAVAAITISQLKGDHAQAMALIKRAVTLNPSCAAAYFFGARIHAFAGHAETAIAHAQRALRLSPYDPLAAQAHGSFGIAAVQQERFGDAAVAFGDAVRISAGQISFLACQALALVLDGKASEARAMLGNDAEQTLQLCLRRLREMGIAAEIVEKLVQGAQLLTP